MGWRWDRVARWQQMVQGAMRGRRISLRAHSGLAAAPLALAAIPPPPTCKTATQDLFLSSYQLAAPRLESVFHSPSSASVLCAVSIACRSTFSWGWDRGGTRAALDGPAM
eukprot:1021564-Rhodomonas_salina.1